MDYVYLGAIFVATVVVFEVIYYIVHHQFGFVNLGRISAALSLITADVLTQIQNLPWSSIVSDAASKVIAFGVAAGLIIRHIYDMVSKPQAPSA